MRKKKKRQKWIVDITIRNRAGIDSFEVSYRLQRYLGLIADNISYNFGKRDMQLIVENENVAFNKLTLAREWLVAYGYKLNQDAWVESRSSNVFRKRP